MTTYHPISCDCIVDVEQEKFNKRCNIQLTTIDVKDCYSHNLSFTGKATDRTSNPTHKRAKTERERIRRL